MFEETNRRTVERSGHHDADQNRRYSPQCLEVPTQNTDFGTREKRERDIFKDLTFRRHDFADAIHGIDVVSHLIK